MGSELNRDECTQVSGALEVVDTSPVGADPAQPLDFSGGGDDERDEDGDPQRFSAEPWDDLDRGGRRGDAYGRWFVANGIDVAFGAYVYKDTTRKGWHVVVRAVDGVHAGDDGWKHIRSQPPSPWSCGSATGCRRTWSYDTYAVDLSRVRGSFVASRS